MWLNSEWSCLFASSCDTITAWNWDISHWFVTMYYLMTPMWNVWSILIFWGSNVCKGFSVLWILKESYFWKCLPVQGIEKPILKACSHKDKSMIDVFSIAAWYVCCSSMLIMYKKAASARLPVHPCNLWKKPEVLPMIISICIWYQESNFRFFLFFFPPNYCQNRLWLNPNIANSFSRGHGVVWQTLVQNYSEILIHV